MNRVHPMSRPRCRQRGVGMIEILITMLVISVAFLGIVALQARALSTSNSSMARTIATLSSYSILDAMRADSANAKAGAYNTSAAGISANNCPAASGTLASSQLNAWCQQLGAALGASGTTTGTIACTADGDCTVTVQFDDSRAGDGGDSAQQFITSAQL